VLGRGKKVGDVGGFGWTMPMVWGSAKKLNLQGFGRDVKGKFVRQEHGE
jgi:hypothetical protein